MTDAKIRWREFLEDDTWRCAHCCGPALFRAKRVMPGAPQPVRFVGYEHRLDCPALEDRDAA